MKFLKNKNTRIKTIIISISIILILIIIFAPHGLYNIIKNAVQKEEEYSFSYEIKKYDINTNEYDILVTVTDPEGIETIKYLDQDNTIKCNGRKKLAFDYITKDMTDYHFEITSKSGQVREETIAFERPRTGKGTYKKVKGIWVHTPNIDDGIQKEYTRYMKEGTNGFLQPANWLTSEEPTDWYDYKNQKWANIYTENRGLSGYYVWIPRYCYKEADDNTTGNERTDIKFIDVYNNYKDPNTDEEIPWSTLQAQGYKIPEAFEFGNMKEMSISGYWISKYELSELPTSTAYKLDYNLTASMSGFYIKNGSINISEDKTVAQYTYAINGNIQHTSATLDDYTFNNTTPDKENIINVTALDAEGRILGSMTRKIELADVNAPDLTGFDPNTTFYVYWDGSGNMHEDIPISQPPPNNWYNYSYSSWANIMVNNNGLKGYYVWIPRYQYMLDPAERVNIKFIKGIGTDTELGYKIPEAFTTETDNGTQELTGYWISKYELSEFAE